MVRKILLWWIWAGFVWYTLRLAPLDQPDTWAIARQLITLQWGELNAYLVAIFWLMGVWPMIYACLMFADGRRQLIPAWPYFLTSNATGVLCLLPYLGLRQPNPSFSGPKDAWLRKLDSRAMGVGLTVCAIALVAYALLMGDWVDFVQQWHTRSFVHLISLDFCLMCLVFPISTLLPDDMARRGLDNPPLFWVAALIPLFGPLLYLCLRPPLPDAASASASPKWPTSAVAYSSSHR
jgi:hypothetical protein